MSKKTKETKTNAPVPAVKITVKTKFPAKSVEAVAIKEIKARERKITKVGKSLVSLWIAQGQEILEFIAITEVSQRTASDILGLKRTAVNTYCTIASDPRMLNPDFQEQLENFSQKDLIKLTKIDDEEAFDEALETGELPKPEHIDVEVSEATDTDADERVWEKELINIIENSADLASAQTAVANYTIAVEAEIDEDVNPVNPLVTEAIELSEETEIDAQAKEIGLKKSVLEKALGGAKLSAKTEKLLTEYINS